MPLAGDDASAGVPEVMLERFSGRLTGRRFRPALSEDLRRRLMPIRRVWWIAKGRSAVQQLRTLVDPQTAAAKPPAASVRGRL